MDESEYIQVFERLWNGGKEQFKLLERTLKAEKVHSTFKHEDIVMHFFHKGMFDVFQYLFMKQDCRIVILLMMRNCPDRDTVKVFINMACYKED